MLSGGGNKMNYLHIITGSIDTKEGWIASYPAEELEVRGLTAYQAFEEDEGNTLHLVPVEREIGGIFKIDNGKIEKVTLFEASISTTPTTCADAGRKGGAAKTEAKRKASAENGKKGGRPKKTTA